MTDNQKYSVKITSIIVAGIIFIVTTICLLSFIQETKYISSGYEQTVGIGSSKVLWKKVQENTDQKLLDELKDLYLIEMTAKESPFALR